MNPVRREPAVLVGLVTAVLGVLLVYEILDEEQASAWGALAMALLPMVQAVVTRGLVMPTHTVKQAGLDPEEVVERAEDPRVQPFGELKR